MSASHEWLNLIEVSGPFLADPVLRQTLPDGLDVLPKGVAPRLRSAYDEWREAVEDRDPRLDRLHAAWIEEVLTQVLEYDDSTLLRGDDLQTTVSVDLPEHGTRLRPDMVLVEPARRDGPLMLVIVTEPDADLDASIRQDGYVASPKERMIALLRGSGCPLGLVTNGEAWTLVHAPEGTVASNATWYARMFGLERDTLRAFASLLGIRRFTGPSSERLPELYERSLQHQGDVTEALGDQVAQAIEVLMHALDRADQDRNRELLKDVAPKRIYEAGLTLMMRLVVILSAEERDLLLLGDPIYDAHYAITSMRSQLLGVDPAVLATRQEAWSRLLATFRLVYAGSDHPDLRLPALGGSLFDPDRFPFLEGRPSGSNWQEDPASPLPIDDRTVLLLLNAIQTFRGRTLSYKALDVEQIGHVYEGLLDQTVGRVDGVTLQLKRSAKVRTPLLSLTKLEAARDAGLDALVKLVTESTERSEAAIRNDLTTAPDKEDVGKLLTSCRGDEKLRDRILPFVRILDDDPWGMPLVHQAGAIVIVKGTDRRESGSHYTPKSLTEKIVEETLTPIVYRGPAEGADRKDWKLKTPTEILDLKICDPAMGSGAFLVQVCRWLSDRLVESWAAAEADGHWIDAEGVVHESADSMLDPMPSDTEERTIEARRLIAERGLYGVDMNPLAVELAKLSLWLTTVAKGRPFGFLDHNLRHGDSLLGISDLDQVIELRVDPKSSGQLRLFGRCIEQAVEEAMKLRRELRKHPVRDISDVKAMERLDARSRQELELPAFIADAFIGCVLAEQKGRALEDGLTAIASLADSAASGDASARSALLRSAREDLAEDEPHGKSRTPFHWPLEFPEVFGRTHSGFDAFVGNPPFVGGRRIQSTFGAAYNDFLVNTHSGSSKNADLVVHFFRRSWGMLRGSGSMGFVATNSISEGDSRQSGLEWMMLNGAAIFAAYPSEKWPGTAAVVTSRVHVYRGEWSGLCILSGRSVSEISSFLTQGEQWSLVPLIRNQDLAFLGTLTVGMGFVLSEDQASFMLDKDPKNADVIFPYLNGQDLNSSPTQSPSRYVINFWDWSEEEAREYDLPFRWIETNVKPERQRKKKDGAFALRQPLPERWWQHGDKRPALYHAIGRGHHFNQHPPNWVPIQAAKDRILIVTRVSKTLAFSFVSADWIYSDATVVFVKSEDHFFSILQSNIHAVFAWQHSSRLKNDLRYSPTDALEPFPFPSSESLDKLRSLGAELHDLRMSLMKSQCFGLTKLYRMMHSLDSSLEDVDRMRELHREIDRSLADAYGWTDIDFGHGFHEVPYLPENDRVRFTISEDARREVLARLSELNRVRYEEEIELGLHGNVRPDQRFKSQGRSNFVAKASGPSLELDLDHAAKSHDDGR